MAVWGVAMVMAAQGMVMVRAVWWLRRCEQCGVGDGEGSVVIAMVRAVWGEAVWEGRW